MPFSYHSFQEIWRRAGGRENAKCFYCEVRHIDGFTLDCSHLDHARDENYDNPDRGILECLECHLKRHIHLYFFVLLKGKKKKSKECRFACMSWFFELLPERIGGTEKTFLVLNPISSGIKKELVKFFRNKYLKQQFKLMKWVLNQRILLGQMRK